MTDTTKRKLIVNLILIVGLGILIESCIGSCADSCSCYPRLLL
jgi:hypothetical protein